MISYKDECHQFQKLFKVFIRYANRLLVDRTKDDEKIKTNSKLNTLLLRNDKPRPNKHYERITYDKFSALLEFIKSSKYIIEYMPYSDITQIINEDSSMDTHDDIQQLIVSLWTKYRDEELENRVESSLNFDLDMDLDWDFLADTGITENELVRLERPVYKIVEHIKLAFLQRSISIKVREDSLKHIDAEIKDKQDILDKLEVKIQTLEDGIDDKLKTNTLSMVSVLGIFAAVLMGAFGAIQGFNSLFANAHALDIGEVLIISSIGASSVLLILFFLLNGIAKITGRSLSSSNEENSTLLEKHPTIVIAHGILLLVAFIGAALQLSNTNLTIAIEGVWWVLPIVYVLLVWLFYRDFKWIKGIKSFLIKP